MANRQRMLECGRLFAPRTTQCAHLAFAALVEENAERMR
jgi:hypothetical protein